MKKANAQGNDGLKVKNTPIKRAAQMIAAEKSKALRGQRLHKDLRATAKTEDDAHALRMT